MKIIYVILSMLLLFLATTLIINLSKRKSVVPQNVEYRIVINDTLINDHSYLIFKEFRPNLVNKEYGTLLNFGVVHNPDCKYRDDLKQ